MGEHTLNVFEIFRGPQTQRAVFCISLVSSELTSTHRHLNVYEAGITKICWPLVRQNVTKQ
jgi:hypothetical protein